MKNSGEIKTGLFVINHSSACKIHDAVQLGYLEKLFGPQFWESIRKHSHLLQVRVSLDYRYIIMKAVN